MPKLADIAQFLDNYLNVFKIEDNSMNGLQVQGAQEVKKIVLGVDAGMELFEKAAAKNAELIIVHHGLFWKNEEHRAVGLMAKRLKFLLERGISLYAAHHPLDTHPKTGNNAAIASKLGLKKTMPFGKLTDGNCVGVLGELEKEMPVDSAISKIEAVIGKIARKDMFGKKTIKKIAIVSGVGAGYVEEAAKQGADLFLTGEPKHRAYHDIKELGINAVFAGHYATETFGVIALGKVLGNRFKGLDLEFIQCPTGL